VKKPAQKNARFERDFLIVESGVVDDDLRTLMEFLLGKPSDEREVRKVIVRLLLQQNSGETHELGTRLVAALFDPRRLPLEMDVDRAVWAVDFKRADGGQSNYWQDDRMAEFVAACRARGSTYNESIGLVAEKLNLSERRVQQIWAKYKDKYPYNPDAPELHRYPEPRTGSVPVKPDS
jgi:hypothetical protein